MVYLIHLEVKPKVEVIEAIINIGININQRNQKGETVLHLVLRKSYEISDQIEIIKELSARGADAKEEGLLYFAAKKNQPEIVKFLV